MKEYYEKRRSGQFGPGMRFSILMCKDFGSSNKVGDTWRQVSYTYALKEYGKKAVDTARQFGFCDAVINDKGDGENLLTDEFHYI